tara:strand:+ start:503 stop:664 length:162 start_codon:yes stop_codon:yes gene_type:complete
MAQRQIKVDKIVWLKLKQKSELTGISMGKLVEYHILREMPLNRIYERNKRKKG